MRSAWGRTNGGPLSRVDLDEAVAGDEFLGLGEWSVGNHGRVLPVGGHETCCFGTGETLCVEQLTGQGEFAVECDLELDVRLDVGLGPFRHRGHAGRHGPIIL